MCLTCLPCFFTDTATTEIYTYGHTLPLHDGLRILVDTGDGRVTSRGGIFVVRVDGALMVKRVARAGLGLSIRSDNPAWPGIEDATARGAEVIGRVVWLGRALR